MTRPASTALCVVWALLASLGSFDDEVYEDQGWFVAVGDGASHLKITDDSLVERESCDAHFFAAGLGEELAKRKVDGRREFWQAWLTERVPAVLAPMAKVKALV